MVDVLPPEAMSVSAAARKRKCTTHNFYNEWKKKVSDPVKNGEEPKELNFEIIQYSGVNFILLTPSTQKV